MTQTPSKRMRRRCCECRKWYVPARSTANTQMTCSRKCRLRRRAKQEKARRTADLENARADDRERQRKHRERKREEKGADPPLSQAGLSVQLRAAVEEIVEDLGQAQRLSQAGLRRRLRRIAMKTLGKMDRSAGNLGTRSVAVTDRPLLVTTCYCTEKRHDCGTPSLTCLAIRLWERAWCGRDGRGDIGDGAGTE